MPRVLAFVGLLALTVYALVDCVQTPDEQVKGVPKVVWLLVILIAPLVGSIAWLLAGRTRPGLAGGPFGSRGGPGRGPGRGPQRPKGPDDDPDFLRRL